MWTLHSDPGGLPGAGASKGTRMGHKYITRLSEDSVRSLAEFWEVLEANREQIDAEVREVALSVPAFTKLVRQMDERQAAEQSEKSRRLEQAALRDRQWGEYLDHLRAQGVTYAQMGVELRDWFELLTAYRRVILKAVLPAGRDRELRVLTAMGQFLDIAMASIGSAYVETKEAAARRAEQQLGLYIDMFQNASLGMLIYSCDDPNDVGSFELIAVNPAATRMAGLQLAHSVHGTIREISPGLLESEVADHFAETVRTGEPRGWQITLGQAPHERAYQSQTVPLSGRYMGVLFEDITERRRAEVQLDRHVAELERSNRELDEFAYVASHDLKAPLRDIHNLANWISEDVGDDLPRESARHLEQLRDRASRMERLLDDLLSYSRAGRLKAPVEPFDLRHAIDNAISLAGIPSGFAVEAHAESIHMVSPRAPLEQVIRNLLGNAVKHHTRSDGRIQISAERRGKGVEISVTDDGPGIPNEFHERVFRMFQTLRPRDEVEGSGMGLAIVKKLVEAHGGRVALESGPERGTQVRFTWPAATNGEATAGANGGS